MVSFIGSSPDQEGEEAGKKTHAPVSSETCLTGPAAQDHSKATLSTAEESRNEIRSDSRQ
jgi:hypothetical protein